MKGVVTTLMCLLLSSFPFVKCFSGMDLGDAFFNGVLDESRQQTNWYNFSYLLGYQSGTSWASEYVITGQTSAIVQGTRDGLVNISDPNILLMEDTEVEKLQKKKYTGAANRVFTPQEITSASYSYGHWIGRKFGPLSRRWNIDIDFFSRGIQDSLLKEKNALPSDLVEKLESEMKDDWKFFVFLKKSRQNHIKSIRWLEHLLEQNAGVMRELEGGVLYVIHRNASAENIARGPATVNDVVVVHIVGQTKADETIINTRETDQPKRYHVGANILLGWKIAFQHMHIGDHWKLYLDPTLAYGLKGFPGKVQPMAAVTFELDIVDIIRNQPIEQPKSSAPNDTDANVDEYKLKTEL